MSHKTKINKHHIIGDYGSFLLVNWKYISNKATVADITPSRLEMNQKGKKTQVESQEK